MAEQTYHQMEQPLFTNFAKDITNVIIIYIHTMVTSYIKGTAVCIFTHTHPSTPQMQVLTVLYSITNIITLFVICMILLAVASLHIHVSLRLIF